MPVLYSPDGQPVSVLSGRIGDYIAQGYKSTPPGGEVYREPGQIPVQVQQQISLRGGTSVNTATLAELVKLPQVGTKIGRKVIENRPYSGVEDLLERVPEVQWLSLANFINVKQEEVAQEEPVDAPDGNGEDLTA